MTVGRLLTFCTHELDSTSEARELVCDVLKIMPVQLVTRRDDDVSSDASAAVLDAVERRKNGTPLAYILNKRDFYGREFTVTSDTLIPQPDTETLVESALEHAAGLGPVHGLRVLDMCTGTGCIGISFACEVASRGFSGTDLTLSDISPKALEVARLNVRHLPDDVMLSIVRSDLFSDIVGRYDMILTNPPYIRSSVIPTLDAQVQAEPLLALDGGEDGLSLIGRIVREAPDHLNEGGALFMEIGYDQGLSVCDLFRSNGFSDVSVLRDLGGNDRVVRGVVGRRS